jgi:FAD/FMN-containing dehydrogenase
MITRRKFFGLGAAVGTAATAVKAFAGRLPRLGFAAQVAKPAASLKGRIHYKDDSQYEIYRKGATWNARKPNRYPSAIVLAESDKDVIAAVKLAKDRGWQVTARSGGHSFTGSHTRDNAVLINISKMKELTADAKARTAVASPAWFGDELNKVLEKDQLIFTTAHDPKVGIGGFVMCGGHSTISRMYGPACANLLAADIVTADGELIHADDKQNSDYFWAIRGAGPGFFGVAVRYYLNLHPLPTVRRMSVWTFQPEHLDDIVMWLGKNENSFPKYLEAVLVGRMAEGKPVLTLRAGVNGYAEKDAAEAVRIFEGCPALGKATAKRIDIPMASGGGIIAGSRQVLDGVWCSAPPEKILPGWRDAFLSLPTPQSFMLWLHWGPVQKLPDMAYSIQGDVYLSPNAIYYDAADDARCAAWSAKVIGKLKPVSVGSQMNDENMPVNKGPYLSKENAAKLEVLRKKYDPQRRFTGFLS